VSLTGLPLAQAIVEHMPRGWSAELRHETQPYITRAADGAHVAILEGGWSREGRVEFLGCWPILKNGQTYNGGKRRAITCSAKRSPEAFAGEIRRRLLPEYDSAYAEAKVWVDRHETAAGEAVLVAQRLASVVDGTASDGPRCSRGDGVFVYAPSDSCISRLTVQPAYGSALGEEYARPVRVDVELHGMAPELAAEVFRLVRAYEAVGTETAETKRVDAVVDWWTDGPETVERNRDVVREVGRQEMGR